MNVLIIILILAFAGFVVYRLRRIKVQQQSKKFPVRRTSTKPIKPKNAGNTLVKQPNETPEEFEAREKQAYYATKR